MSRAARDNFSSSTPVSHLSQPNFLQDTTFTLQQTNVPSKLPYLELILEAVETVGVRRKGASYQAIKKYVQDMHGNEDDGQKPLSMVHFKKALTKGLDTGLIEKSNASKNALGVLGHYILVKKGKGAKLKAATEVKTKLKPKRIPKAESSDSEALPKKSIKPKKLNLSDSAIYDKKTMARPRIDSKELARKNLKKKNDAPKAKQTTKPEKVKKTEKENNEVPLKLKKTAKSNEKSKKPNQKTALGRKDVSDSEMVVKKPNRKSLKPYSSDTEVTEDKEAAKPRKKNAPREANAKVDAKKKAKPQIETAEVANPPKTAKGKKTLYKAEEVPMVGKVAVKPKTRSARKH